jgi:DNA-binding MarR family transcriptional regulator
MTLCAYLDKLEGLGLVERQKCTADRRAKRVNLTASSTEMISALREELRGIIACATDAMGEERRRLLKELLESFNASLQSQPAAQGAAREDQPA